MAFLSKHKLMFIIGVAIVFLFFATRFYNITNLPIFTDEAIYLRWAQIAKNDANWRFISLTDGKQPLFIWLIMIVMRFVHDPLLAGRFVSVVAGFCTMIGLFFLGREIFKSNRIGILSSVLYLLFPMALVYDRMALYDSLVGTFAVWSLYLTVLLARRVRLDIALILGMIMGGGVLTKTSGFFNMYLLPLSLLLFDFSGKTKYKRLVKWVELALVACVLLYLFYSILRLSPFFNIIDEKNALFVYPLREWFMHPLQFLVGNLLGQGNWLYIYMTMPLLLLVPLAFVINKEFLKEKIFLILWFFLPFFALALFAKTLFPRFIFFMTLPLLLVISFSFYHLGKRIKKITVLILFSVTLVFLALYADYGILTDFSHATIPCADKDQYSNNWPSGGGVKESVAFFKEQAERGKIYIGTQGTFGLLPYGLELYLVDNPSIVLKGFWPTDDVPPKEIIDASKKMPTYVIFYQPCNLCRSAGVAPNSWKVELVSSYAKPNGKSSYSIYRLRP